MKRVIARVPNSDRTTEFNVVLVEVGDRYGLHDCLVHNGGRGVEYRKHMEAVRPVEDADQLVEFYDAKSKFADSEYGHFVQRYFAGTLLSEPGSFGTSKPDEVRGISLWGGEPVWSVDADAMAVVLAAIAGATGRVANYRRVC